MSEFSGYGFAAGDVRGTRAWKVDRLGRLTGVTYEQVWRPGENVAECKRTRTKPNPLQRDEPKMTVTCSCASPQCTRYQSSLDPAHMLTYQMDYMSVSGNSFLYGGSIVSVSEPDPCGGMDPECRCGFYAYQEGSNDYYKPGKESSAFFGTGERVPVGGVVQGYGKAVLGTRGFRSEKARILALFIDKSQLSDIALKIRIERNYASIPIFADYEQMLREFPPTPPEAAGNPQDDDFWTRSAS